MLVSISSTTFADCGSANASVLRADYGGVKLSDGTIFRNITGVTIFVGAATLFYMLPAPAGRYLPSAAVCTVAWWPCPAGFPCYLTCGANNISLYPSAPVDTCGQRPPFNVQGCPWSHDLSTNAFGPSILGKYLSTILPAALSFSEFPIPCAAGIRGATADDVLGQASPFCAGFCDAGFYCPTVATVEPLPCPTGAFCPAGSIGPQLCPSGTYSNSTHLSAASQCLWLSLIHI